LPKNFQPVGVSKKESPSLLATWSSAPLVGMLLATPCHKHVASSVGCASVCAWHLGQPAKGLPTMKTGRLGRVRAFSPEAK
jgi:hypothetical protein